MKKKFISFKETKRFSTLITTYLENADRIQPFHGLFPSAQNFKKQIEVKKASYSDSHRQVLAHALQDQYSAIPHSVAVQKNLSLLKSETTFTITTGHQLSLMTGPLYFLYKIVSTINLCKQLKKDYPKSNFVPVYWMASEDHDFEEISSFRFQGKSIRWPGEAAGAVGEMSLEELQPALDVFEQQLGGGVNAERIKELITQSYRTSKTLSEATFRLVNLLFGDYGLIVIEPQKPKLKALFKPILKEELFKSPSFNAVTKQIKQLKKGFDSNYTPQVNPREINLFYLTPNGRHRIEKIAGGFHLNGTEQSFTEAEFMRLVEQQPERFSPNVILRPVYQEYILPNLCYIGGGGELAYWFQLNSTFSHFNVPFPILLLRNSALIYSEKLGNKITKLKLETSDLFKKRNALLNKKVRQISNIDLDLSPLKEQLKNQFDSLQELVAQTDPSFKGAVDAQKTKQFRGIEYLEKRLLKAQKRVLKDDVERLIFIHEQLFPNDSLQERALNFTSFYLELGPELIPNLMDSLDPLNPDFVLLEY
ncbi:bacillithiol biosynthesis cysteine-adding enzyme BshC [Flavobacteriaceae bacterium]|nr:bacillithiol biosynthesis cysteine-adding enzyme BshC [Flavobacteriaceae bacterium]